MGEESHHVSRRAGYISYICYACHSLLDHLKLFLCICHIVVDATRSRFGFLGRFGLGTSPVAKGLPEVGLQAGDLVASCLGDQRARALLEKVVFETLVDGGFDGVGGGCGRASSGGVAGVVVEAEGDWLGGIDILDGLVQDVLDDMLDDLLAADGALVGEIQGTVAARFGQLILLLLEESASDPTPYLLSESLKWWSFAGRHSLRRVAGGRPLWFRVGGPLAGAATPM